MGGPNGFDYSIRGEDVVITHHGRTATVLRGRRAVDFLAEVDDQATTGPAPQELMARVTGNYRRGNERVARNHLRNRGR